ncbi:winged helix-turn-helix domain-containing protein [Salinarchaeum laminariae]|uniref:winged helix-turn-helix domain-containing protein n=1 Tax=Salinarchaeum laminariae TaxID=869888 RepID=UPI0020BF7DA7|nr:helix-turn-helix domain-containing protein [Salinarchaeum laminariae]
MVRDPFEEAETPELAALLDALSDPDCRELISAIDSPMTAAELSDVCDIPQSTTYRKLDQLSEATLLEELTEIRSDGRHTTRYAIAFENVDVGLDETRSFTVEITRPTRTADERLARMWSEVQKEL